MITIKTKYLGPTNTKGSRVKAFNAYHSITRPWDHALEPYENHRNAALQLIGKIGYPRTRYVCGWESNREYVFIEDSKINEIAFNKEE